MTEMNTNYHDVFSKGCLVQLTVSKWGATKKLSHDEITSLGEKAGKVQAWLRANKSLVDTKALKKLNGIAAEARVYLDAVCLPFPIRGMKFIPKDIIGRVDKHLEAKRSRFITAVGDFAGRYPALREEARFYLDELFSDMDYPMDIEGCFGMEWRFLVMDTPENMVGISPELYEKEKAKFVATMDEAREMAVLSIRDEFGKMVWRLNDKLAVGDDGEKKMFKKSTVEKFYEFFSAFEDKNIFNDEEMQGLVDTARSLLKGVDAQTVRDDDALRRHLVEGFSHIEDTLETMAVRRPLRKIRLDDPSSPTVEKDGKKE